MEITYHLNGVNNFRLGCFATGPYACICWICGKEFLGDKRAVECLACSIKGIEDALNLSTTSASPKCALPVHVPFVDAGSGRVKCISCMIDLPTGATSAEMRRRTSGEPGAL